MNRVVVFSSVPRFRGFSKKVKVIAEKALKFLKKDRYSLDIYLVTDGVIRSLNYRFRKRNKATNVLSFENKLPFPEPKKKRTTLSLGEIFLAPDYIRKRREDVGLLVVHGILHLLGYTHNKKSDTIKMEKLERKTIKQLTSDN
jgi:probable rRNA maturation factor